MIKPWNIKRVYLFSFHYMWPEICNFETFPVRFRERRCHRHRKKPNMFLLVMHSGKFVGSFKIVTCIY